MAHHFLKQLIFEKIFLLNDLDLLFSAKKNFAVFFQKIFTKITNYLYILSKVFRLAKTHRKLPVPEFLYFCQVKFVSLIIYYFLNIHYNI